VFPLIEAVYKQLQIGTVAKLKKEQIFIFDSSTTKQRLHCCLSLLEDGDRLKQA